MREAQFFGQQIERSVGARGLVKCCAYVFAGPTQRLDVARARNEQALRLSMPACNFEQFRAQCFDAGPGESGERNSCAGGRRFGDLRWRRVGLVEHMH